MTTKPHRPEQDEAGLFDPRLGWAYNGRGLEAQIAALDYARHHPTPLPTYAPPTEETAQERLDRLYQQAQERADREAAGIRKARGMGDAEFRQSRGITARHTDGRPDRPSQTYEGRRLRQARKHVAEGRYASVEEALSKMEKRGPSRA